MTTSSAETVRAFIAVRPNKAAHAELVRVQRELKKNLAESGLRIKWTDPDTFHITLIFFGDIPANDVERTFQCLEKSAQKFPKVGTSINSLGLFKKSGAIWVGIDASPKLLELQQELAESLGREPGRFHAHFTLGRIKRGRPDQKTMCRHAVAFQCLENMKVNAVPFEVSSIELVQSELLPDGARHTVLGVAPLAK